MHRILKTWSSWSRKANAIFNLIAKEIDINKTDLQAKGPYKPKYQLWINKSKNSGFYWIFKQYGWHLKKYWRIQSK